jgi:hypothetical protein
MAHGQITAADIQAVSDGAGVVQFLAKLGYDVSEPADQTAAGLGVAERTQHLVRTARRLVGQRPKPGLPPALEVYWFETTVLTADLRQTLVAAFRNKPAQVLLLVTTRDFGQIDFVLVQKSLAVATAGGQVSVSHQLFSVDRRHPSRVHMRVVNRMANVAKDSYAQFDRIRDAFRLAEWSEDEFNNRNLFSDYFLKNRLPQQSQFPIWHADFKPAYKQLATVYRDAGDVRQLAPDAYLGKFIEPLVDRLGFTPTSGGTGNGDADYLLRPSSAPADAPPVVGLIVYPWDRPLDRKDDQDRPRAEDVPGIRIVKVLEEQKLPWAILTNGKDWRLYCAQAHSRATNYYEIDLADALEHQDLIAFRYFYLFFRAEAFATSKLGQQGFLDQLREGSSAFAKELGDRLRKHIFDEVFPYLAQGFVDYRKQELEEKTGTGDPFLNLAYDATLTLLYRLLFLLYAESLDLLPVHEPAYALLSLSRLKEQIRTVAGTVAEQVEDRLKAHFTKSDTSLYDNLVKLFKVIDKGSQNHNVPVYNGGLFNTAPNAKDSSREAEAARFLKKHKVPDFYLARAIDLLARSEDAKSGELVFVDYKSLGVRQLGSVYEGLLMYHVVVPNDDWEKEYQRHGLKIALVPSNKDRKSTGSYFTPQHIVKYIVTNAVGPLLEEKFAAIAPKLRAAQREYHEQRKYEADRNLSPILRKGEEVVFDKYVDVVHELLDIKVVDVSMGSGHFVVETVDFITDRVLEFLAGFPWNPVQVFVQRRVRGPIVDSLEAQGVKINEQRLTDVNLIKRLVMKRCVYGVDINPMAVELAKVSVWLDSFTVGAPLSFMDHHFKCGNSLIGSSIADLKKLAEERGGLWSIPMEPLERATKNMEKIADLSDVTLSEVNQSASTYQEVLAGVKGYRVLLDCMTAEHFGVEGASALVTEGHDLDLEHWDDAFAKLPAKDKKWVEQATKISEARRFFHWDVDFPDVFFTSRRPERSRRFDAVVGNPPYDRLAEADLGPEIEVDKSYYRSLASFAPSALKEMNLWRLFVNHFAAGRQSARRCGMIVPMGLLADDSARDLRVHLLKNMRVLRIEAFPQKDDPKTRVFIEAKLSTAIFIVDDGALSPKDRTIVRCHPADVVATDSPSYLDRQSVFLDFEPENCPIPRCTQLEWDLAKRLALGSENGSVCSKKMRLVAKHFEGEVPQKKPLGIFGQSGDGPIVLRGSHIARYAIQSARQGEELYLLLDRFLTKTPSSDGRLSHVSKPRLVYQEAAPEDNYRRLIPAMVPAGQYVGHTIHYVPETACQYSLDAMLAILASSFSEWFFGLLSSNNHISQYKVHAFPLPRLAVVDKPVDVTARLNELLSGDDLGTAEELRNTGHGILGAAAFRIRQLTQDCFAAQTVFQSEMAGKTQASDAEQWSGTAIFRDMDYFGWEGRYPKWRPDDQTLSSGRYYPNGVAPPIEGNGLGAVAWDLLAAVYPSYPLPAVDESSWESTAWEELCDLLRKNKTKIGNTRIKADLTGSGAVVAPTGPLKKLQESFLKCHREVRQNRAKAAELDYLIDRIVFRLFDLTLDEQKLILSRVGPGRPLPPRRNRGGKGKAVPKDVGPGLFGSDSP